MFINFFFKCNFRCITHIHVQMCLICVKLAALLLLWILIKMFGSGKFCFCTVLRYHTINVWNIRVNTYRTFTRDNANLRKCLLVKRSTGLGMWLSSYKLKVAHFGWVAAEISLRWHSNTTKRKKLHKISNLSTDYVSQNHIIYLAYQSYQGYFIHISCKTTMDIASVVPTKHMIAIMLWMIRIWRHHGNRVVHWPDP